MKKPNKKEIYSLIDIIGQHLEKYWIMVIVILGVIISSAIGFIIAWNLSPDNVELSHEVGYYIAQGSLITISLAGVLFVVLSKKKSYQTYHSSGSLSYLCRFINDLGHSIFYF